MWGGGAFNQRPRTQDEKTCACALRAVGDKSIAAGDAVPQGAVGKGFLIETMSDIEGAWVVLKILCLGLYPSQIVAPQGRGVGGWCWGVNQPVHHGCLREGSDADDT